MKDILEECNKEEVRRAVESGRSFYTQGMGTDTKPQLCAVCSGRAREGQEIVNLERCQDLTLTLLYHIKVLLFMILSSVAPFEIFHSGE